MTAPVIKTFDYGSVVLGTPAARVLTYVNSTDGPRTLDAMTFAGKPVVITNNTCLSGKTIALNQTCTFTATLTPTAVGRWDTVISLANTASTYPDQFALRSLGVSPDNVLRFDQSMVDFGSVPVQTTTGVQSLKLTNSGTSSVGIAALRLGENQAFFELDSGPCEGTLDAGTSCTVTATFTPRYLGAVNARVLVDLDTGDTLYGATLTGTGVQGAPTFSASQLNFTGVASLVKSVPRTLTLSNTGSGAFGISSLAVSGDAAFTLESSTCGLTLAAGSSCDILIAVTPPDADQHSAVVTLDATGVTTRLSRVQLFAKPATLVATLDVTPLALNFGNVQAGTSSTQNLVLKSTGTLAVTVSGYSFSGADAARFSLVNPTNCIGALAPGLQCTLQVKVSPGVDGPLAANLAVASDLSTPVAPVALTATGMTGELTVVPAIAAIAGVQVGSSGTLAVTLSNTGNAPLTITSRTFAATLSSTLGATGCEGVTLGAAQTCTMTLTFTPTSAVSQAGGITFTNTGIPASVLLPVSLQANPAPTPVAELSAFTCTPVPAQTGTLVTCTATLSNTGPVMLGVSSMTRTGASFSAPTSTCGTTLASSASCVVTTTATSAIALKPATTISLTTTAGVKTGNVIAEFVAPSATLTPLGHGTVQVGSSNVRSHAVSNTGQFPITVTMPATLSAVTGLSVAGTPATGTACTSGLGLVAGATCYVTTTCAPGTNALLNPTLSVTTSAGAVTGSVACQGEFPPATGTSLAFSPNPMDYGNIVVGNSSTQAVTVTNNAISTLTVSSMSLGGAPAGAFTMVTNGCVGALASKATCTLTIKAAASVKGMQTALLTAVANTITPIAPMTLRFTGTQGTLAVTPVSADFGHLITGTSGTNNFIVRNSGDANATVSSVSLSGTNANQFAVSGNTCSAGLSLAPNATCTFNVVYSPTVAGTATAAVSVASPNASNPSSTVGLTGLSSAPLAPTISVTNNSDCSAHVQFGQPSVCSVTVKNTGATDMVLKGYVLQRVSGDQSATQPSKTVTGVSAFTGLSGGAALLSSTILSLPVGASVTLPETITAVKVSNSAADTYSGYSSTVPAVNTVTFTTTPALAASPASTATSTHYVEAPVLVVTGPVPALQVQQGTAGQALVTLTNKGLAGVNMTAQPALFPYQPYYGTSAVLTGVVGGTSSTLTLGIVKAAANTCTPGQSLLPGQSCSYALTCALTVPNVKVAGTFNFLADVSAAGGSVPFNVTTPFTCVSTAPSGKISATYPTLSSTVATGSQSGNWLRFTNTGNGPLTVTTLAPDPATTLFVDPAIAGHCNVSKVVKAGESCDFLEVLTRENPSAAPLAVQTYNSYLRTNLGSFLISSSYSVVGLSVTPQAALNPVIQRGETRDVTLVVNNATPSSATGFVFEPIAFTSVKSHTCTTLAPGASCTVTLTLAPSASATAALFATSLNVKARFDRLLNGVAYPAVVLANAGSWKATFTQTVPSATLTLAGSFDVQVGKVGSATATFTNTGKGPLHVSSVVPSPAPPYSVGTNGCASEVAPGASCLLSIQFTATQVGAFPGSLSVNSEAAVAPLTLYARAVHPDVQPWTIGSANPCNGWNWGFDMNGDVQCNIFGISKFRDIGYSDTTLIDSPAKISKYYLIDPFRAPVTMSTYANSQRTYVDFNSGCGYWNETYRTGRWSDLMLDGFGPVYTSSSGTKYVMSTCSQHTTPGAASNSINILYRGSFITALNPDGSLKYNHSVGGSDTSRIPAAYSNIGNAFDEARDTAFMGGVTSGQSYSGFVHRIQLSTGAIVSSWPTSQYGALFAYDNALGDMYFVKGSYYIGNPVAPTNKLTKVNPYTGATSSITVDTVIDYTNAGQGMVAWKGMLYVIEGGYGTFTTLYRIDTTVTPAHAVVLSTRFTSTATIKHGGPGDNTLYVDGHGVKISLP